MPRQESILINASGARLALTIPRGKVRIADLDGNHFGKPTSIKNIPTHWIEWMITNNELQQLALHFLNKKQRKSLRSKIKDVQKFLNKTSYAKRATRKKPALLARFGSFNIFEYKETFFSFEMPLEQNIKIRVTFKMGDYTLAPHMFILLPFDADVISLSNREGAVTKDSQLGSGCCAVWKPGHEIISAAMCALAHASEGHKEDLLNILKQIKSKP